MQRGNKVGIVATARRVTEDQMRPAIAMLQQWGVEVVLSPQLFQDGHSYLAGNDERRVAGLQQFLDDPETSAIICARGGYGTTRIIDDLDFTEFKKHPKWIVGFSDVTALHLKLAALGFESIHGTMPILFAREDSASSVDYLKQMLFGSEPELQGFPSKANRNGKATGKLIGGNLSLLTDSLGTPYQVETAGKILILEEVDEYLYKIDRMLVQLKRAGKLSHLAGLVLGHFTDIKDTELSFGETVEQIISFHVREFAYPVAFNFPIGHENPNLPWIQGREALLDVQGSGASLKHASLPGPV